MESYATALLYATPFFISLVLFEVLYGHFVKKQMHNVMDTVSSLSSGITNVVKDSLGLGIVIVTYPFLLEYLALTQLQTTWLVWLTGFVVLDFAGYWNHRLSHSINFFWNQHVIHHSSEEFNLACALRQSISNLLGYFPLLLIPAALLGVPHNVIAILGPIHLFAQFWYHTRHIGKMGWLEYVIVTPSQHRVHHAINPEYIDKNLGQIFSFWDRIFGTFQEELPEVTPQYGVLKPASTWNPIRINFQHLWRLIMDAWRTKSYWDKFRIWFMPTGWRPKDVKEKYPIYIIEDVYNRTKFRPKASMGLKGYSIFQLIINTVLMLFMFFNYSSIGFDGLLIYGAYIFVGIYGYSSLMDGDSYAAWIEVFRGVVGLVWIASSGDWFGLDAYLSWGSYLVATYFMITILGGIYFGLIEKRDLKMIF